MESTIVFISYSHLDIDIANELSLILGREGISCCLLRKDYQSQTDYEIEAFIKIRESKLFVPIWSNNSCSNYEVLKQIDWANQEGKIIIPFITSQNIEKTFSILNNSMACFTSCDLIRRIKDNLIEAPKINIVGMKKIYPIGSIYTKLIDSTKSNDLNKNLKVGDHVMGKVVKIARYGAFVKLEIGIIGLIHIKDLSWSRITNPQKVVHINQKVNVTILNINYKKKRISLGLKQLTPHPWDALDENLKVGDYVKGKVVVIAEYGAFVEIAPGVEGLIHVSEMSWGQHLRSAQKFMNVGDEVEAVILTLDRAERKMSLGIKQLKDDPWGTIDVKYPLNSRHTAKVRNFTNFGIFVELEESVDGLIHISDLSWTKKVKHPSEFTQVGAPIDVVVLEIDKENRRLSLGHKQLEDNPWDTFESVYTLGSVHIGKITEIITKGAVIALNEGGEGFAAPKHLVKEDGSQAQLGEVLPFKVTKFEKMAKRIILSHRRTYEKESLPQRKRRNKTVMETTYHPFSNILKDIDMDKKEETDK